ncbi:MAG TPA: ATP-dependent DNA ligase [Patescibacteria group bacterium]
MTFAHFAAYLEELEATSSRLEMTDQLSKLFQELAHDEIPAACYLMQGQLVPTYQSLEFQLSTKMVVRALSRLAINGQPTAESTNLFGEVTEADNSQVTKLFKELGDMGLVAHTLLVQKGSPKKELSILEVYDRLVIIAQESGQGSQERKLQQLTTLLADLDALSAKFVSRIVVGKLRLGFSTMTMLDALSWTMAGDKSEASLLEDAYQKKADIGLLAQQYLSQNSPDQRQKMLTDMSVEVGIPVVPALCQRLNSSAEIIAKMGEVIAEPKYDGLRVQIHIHKKEKKLSIFTRNLENVSHMFPELNAAIDQLNVETAVLDGEAIGYNRETGEIVTFQETSTRRRKHEIEETAKKVPLRFYIFDVLALNGKSLLPLPLRERKDVLHNLFKENEVLYKTPSITTSDPEVLRNFHNQQLAKGLEGAVIKQIDSPYQSGRKGWSWVKIKEEEGATGKLKDTLDVVVMGYYFGRGKRTGFGIGAILVGVKNEGQEKPFVTIAKIGTGLSDEQLREMKRRLDELAVTEQPKEYDVSKALVPDVWAAPDLVIEVAADELTKSPNHSAGVALRFPRLVKIREDKSAEQATTVSELDSLS